MPDLDPAIIRAEAERKVRAALNHIEAAQRSLEKACQELCPVIGALPDYERVSKLSLKVNALWHRIYEVKPKCGYRLDGDGIRALEKRIADEGRHA